MEKFTEKPAVGTRVTLRKVDGDVWYFSRNGKSGEVTEHHEDDRYAGVRFDDGDEDYGQWTSLEPEAAPAVAAPAQPAPEVTLNGHRYVLAPEQAEAKEEKREPQAGEVWRCVSGKHTGRFNGDLYHVITYEANRLEDKRFVALGSRNGIGGGIWLTSSLVDGDVFEFAYPSLADAIEAGEKFK